MRGTPRAARAAWRLAKLADVGARNEGLACAHQQHARHGAVGLGLCHGGGQPLAHGHAQRIDRRVVDGDDQHGAARAVVTTDSGGSCAHAGVSWSVFCFVTGIVDAANNLDNYIND
jgi:hypothetical protein